MRRTTLAAGALAIFALVGSTLTPAASADDDRPDGIELPSSQGQDLEAVDTLAQAQRVMSGQARSGDPEPTIALRNLRMALPRLQGEDRELAKASLSRPTDPGSDDPYTVKSVKKCDAKLCVHRVKTTEDRASRKWTNTTLKVMQQVWALEINKLGYRKPLKDGKRGGNNKLDIYLKELHSSNMFGYCATERRIPGALHTATAYCVLDNDFAGYSSPPRDSLRVTAAHEFFHASHFAYDFGEDVWMLESSATWMEERFADDVNDNRLYLSGGQISHPEYSLDWFDQFGFNQYGNWAFFEYLSARYGNGIVKRIWQYAGQAKGDPKKYSIQAVQAALRDEGDSFPDVFAKYAAANTAPDKAYEEGGSWPSATIAATYTLSKTTPASETTPVTIDHLASQNVRYSPDSTLANTKWKLRIKINGPARKTTPRAYLLLRQPSGKLFGKAIKLNKNGDGSIAVPFSSQITKNITVTLVNASTKMNCWEQTRYVCQGIPRHEDQAFTVSAKAFKP